MNLFLSCTAVILLHVAVGQKPQDAAPCDPTLWDEVECKVLLRKNCKDPSMQRVCRAFGNRHRKGLHDDFKNVFYELCVDRRMCRRILDYFYSDIEKSIPQILSVYAGIPDNLDKSYIKLELGAECFFVNPPCKELSGLHKGHVNGVHSCVNNTKECVTMLRSHCKDGNQIGAFCDDVYNKISPEVAYEIIPCDTNDMDICGVIKKLIMKKIDGQKLFAGLCSQDVKSDKCGRLTASKGWCSQDDEKKQEACQMAIKLKSDGTAKKEISDLADASKFNKEFIVETSKISTWCDGNATADCKAVLDLAKANKNIPNSKIVEVACAIKGNNEFDLPNVCDDVSVSSIWAEEGVGKQCTTREAQRTKEICKSMNGACGVDAYKAKVYCKEYSENNAKLEDQENVEMCKNAANSGKKDELSNCLSMASKICPKAAANAKCVPIFSAAFDAIKDDASLVKTALHTWCQDFPKEDNPEVSDTLKDKMTVCYMFADNVDKGSMMDKVFAAKKSDEADECDIEKTDKFNDHDKHCKFIENYCRNKTANSCKVLNENIRTQRWNKDLCADKDNCTAALDKYCIKSTAKCQDTVDLLQKLKENWTFVRQLNAFIDYAKLLQDHLQDPIIIGMFNITGSGDHCEKIVDKFIKLKISTDVVNKTCTEQTVETTFCKILSNKCKDETAGDECPQIMGYMNSLNKNGKDSSDKDEIENLENQILYCQIGAGVGGALCVLSLSMCFVCKGMANKSKKKKKGGGSDDSTQL